MEDLRSIRLTDLEEGSGKALRDLHHAAQGPGMFYLDLHDSQGSSLWQYMQECIAVMARVYQLPLEEKLRFDIDKLGPHKLNGYKPAGRNTGVAKDKQDGFEAYLLPRDGVCNDHADHVAPFVAPHEVSDQIRLFNSTMQQSHNVCTTILRALAGVLNLDVDAFERYHRPEQPSTSAFGVLKYMPLVEQSPWLGHGAHTDVGSLTLLHAAKAGLQIGDLEQSQWYDVEPKDGHLVVNLGDSLRFMSGGQLHSCVHRVVPAAAGTAHANMTSDNRNEAQTRFSCAYFLRPELDAPLVDDSGLFWSSIQWHAKKYKTFRASFVEQEREGVMTGKAGSLGLWESVRA